MSGEVYFSDIYAVNFGTGAKTFGSIGLSGFVQEHFGLPTLSRPVSGIEFGDGGFCLLGGTGLPILVNVNFFGQSTPQAPSST